MRSATQFAFQNSVFSPPGRLLTFRVKFPPDRGLAAGTAGNSSTICFIHPNACFFFQTIFLKKKKGGGVILPLIKVMPTLKLKQLVAAAAAPSASTGAVRGTNAL